MSFTSQLHQISRKTANDIDTLIRAIKIEIFRRVIMNTRVDTGRAKGNWQITEGSPAKGEVENFDTSTGGQLSAEKLMEMNTVIKGISLSYLTNNLPYIHKLEELDAMVATAVLQVEQIIKENARR